MLSLHFRRPSTTLISSVTMSRRYSSNHHPLSDNSYRPARDNNYRPSSNNSYRPSGNNRNSHTNSYTPINSNDRDNRNSHQNNYNSRSHNTHWKDAKDEKLDDLIAPKHTSQSIASLQRWAFATANFIQQGHHHKDLPVITRIERRYGNAETNPNAPFPRYSNFADDDEVEVEVNAKRRYSISPVATGREMSAVSVLRDSKRRRLGGDGEVVDLTGGDGDEEMDDYAESSEWSFPDSDMEITDVRGVD